MKLRRTLLAAAPAALLVPLALAQDEGEGEARGDRGLVPVGPLEGEEERTTPAEETGGLFHAERWRERLSNPDLEVREQDFERLVHRARHDHEVRRFLEELAEGEEPELAWTARLALRELARGGSAFLPLLSPRARLFDPYASLEDMFADLAPGLRAFPPHAFRLQLPRGAEGESEERSMSVQRTPEGWRIEIREQEDGDVSTRVYEGESLDAILRENPELSEELDITHLGAPQGFRMDLPMGRGGPGGSHLRELLQGLEGAFPGRVFEWPFGDGGKGRMRFFFSPEGPSRPVRTDVLGVRVEAVSEAQASELGLAGGRGLYVSSVLPGTIAHLMGLASGDVLLEMNGVELASAEDITRAMRERAEGGEIRLVWLDALGGRRERTWRPAAGSSPPEDPEDPEDAAGGGGAREF